MKSNFFEIKYACELNGLKNHEEVKIQRRSMEAISLSGRISITKKQNHASSLHCFKMSVPILYFQGETRQLHSLKFMQSIPLTEKEDHGDFQEVTVTVDQFSKEKIKKDRKSASSQTDIRGFALRSWI